MREYRDYRVLIVDDDKQWCQALEKAILELNMFQLCPLAHDGKEAIRMVEEWRPDIVILDLILPIYDGLYIINYIGRNLKPYVPFIYVLSAIGTDKTNKIMRNIRADYYSVKPISAPAVAENLVALKKEWLQERVVQPLPGVAGLAEIDLDRQIEDYLYDLGAPLYRISTNCLKAALRLALEDIGVLQSAMNLYKLVGDQQEISAGSPGSVERNIRTALKYIKEASTPYFQKHFKEENGRLTNTKFLDRSVYIIRARIEDSLVI